MNEKTRVMVFGTFDGIHEGHRDLFRQARLFAENPYLIVSVARDVNVVRIKGRSSRANEETRKAELLKEPLVDEVVLGDLNGCIPHIVLAHPDIIALGYDQEGQYVEKIKRFCKATEGKIKLERCAAFQPDIYKSSKILYS